MPPPRPNAPAGLRRAERQDREQKPPPLGDPEQRIPRINPQTHAIHEPLAPIGGDHLALRALPEQGGEVLPFELPDDLVVQGKDRGQNRIGVSGGAKLDHGSSVIVSLRAE